MRKLSRFLGCVLVLGLAAGNARAAATWSTPLEACTMVRHSSFCGELEVAENRADPSARRIALRVVVVPALYRPSRLDDPVLVIDGAPGATVIPRAPRHVVNLVEIHEHRDLVFVEQRGTGESNALDCGLDLGMLDASAVAECRERLGRSADLRFYGSPDVAADLAEAIEALGYEQVNVFAQSYGTRTAIELVRRHPELVRTLALLGTYPPDRNAVAEAPALLDRSLERVASACHANMTCRAAYPGLGEALANLPERLDAGDLGISRLEASLALRRLLLSSLTVGSVPRVVTAVTRGEASLLQVAARSNPDEDDEVTDGAYLSVLCSEDVARLEPEDEEEARVEHLLPASWSRDLVESCRAWPNGELPADFRSPLDVKTPILSLTGELDPIVDPSWGAELTASIRGARHFTIPSAQHRLRGLRGAGCVMGIVRQLFETGRAVGLDTSCLTSVRMPMFQLPSRAQR